MEQYVITRRYIDGPRARLKAFSEDPSLSLDILRASRLSPSLTP